ncbi:MAG TPA: multicopper oxidase domain-containing protein [Vicinamibacterales bacterium]|nr:multicopper oxidase domain-containing protein [Vicinamibacterales bacterium]
MKPSTTPSLSVSRRSWLRAAGLTSLGSALFSFARLRGQAAAQASGQADAHASHGSAHGLGTVGQVSKDIFDPVRFLRAWNFNDLPPAERAKYYRETPRPDGTLLREYEFFAVDREIEIAPGIFYPAWTYNGQVPGPTIRATEGDRLRIRFVNQGSHLHTIHFHGWHPPEMDGSLPEHQVPPGGTFVYEFDAEPAGLHLYHCHAVPLKRHIHKGLYGAFIVDPKGDDPTGRDDLVMIMNAFDTNFDSENEVYAVNTIANAYMTDPIRVVVGQPVRIYLVNITEFDLLNSFHLHGMFFTVNRTGTARHAMEVTDTVMLCQGERAILETTFRYPGDYMFHAHQSEFAELGWMGLFRAEEAPRET